jgi:two-component system phosphate regulon response regulator OmpR
MAVKIAAPKILVVDDDVRLRDLLTRYLAEQGFQVSALADARDIDKKLQRDPPHLIVLDLMLPGEDGLAVCRRLRAAGETVPIIMLTAKGEDVDRIVGLEMGADDYLGKPFNPRELVARIHAVLRRPAERLALAAPAARGTMPSGRSCSISRSAHAPRRTRTDPPHDRRSRWFASSHSTRGSRSRGRSSCCFRAGADHDVFDRAIDVRVSRLRKLIRADPADPRYLQTVWGSATCVPADEALAPTAADRPESAPR